jgi:hypothetical protein
MSTQDFDARSGSQPAITIGFVLAAPPAGLAAAAREAQTALNNGWAEARYDNEAREYDTPPPRLTNSELADLAMERIARDRDQPERRAPRIHCHRCGDSGVIRDQYGWDACPDCEGDRR